MILTDYFPVYLRKNATVLIKFVFIFVQKKPTMLHGWLIILLYSIIIFKEPKSNFLTLH